MGTTSGSNQPHHHYRPPSGMLPPRQQPRLAGLPTSLSLASSDPAASPETQDPRSNSDEGHDSPTESASSRETWPTETNQSDAHIPIKVEKEKEGENEISEMQVIRRVSGVNRLTLREVARDRVEIVSEKMKAMPNELLDELKNELRGILEGAGSSQHTEEFLYLQKLVKGRMDLTDKSLTIAHPVQLAILTAISTGIQAFLHPSVSMPQNRLSEVFLYKRCRNISCQNVLPADECNCEICVTHNGFCNLCMCVLCSKFDFEVNTCRWIGCDMCTHWTHTDCAMRYGKIGTSQSVKNGVGQTEMLFRCPACHRACELLGWVKDVFQQCAPGWDHKALMRELDFVSKIFHSSQDPKGRMLHRKCDELLEKLRTGTPEATICRMLLLFLQELEIDSPKNSGSEEVGRLISPQEACNKIAEVVQEAVRKMEMVAEEKMRMFTQARLALEACDRQLGDKAREVEDIKAERQRKKQQVEELESLIKLKQAEAEMFQMKANEAKQEAERLQSIALAKSEKAEQDYASMYLKRRLEEAEAEKQYLYEQIRLQESQWPPQGGNSAVGDVPQTMMLNKIQDLLKNVYSIPPKSEAHQSK